MPSWAGVCAEVAAAAHVIAIVVAVVAPVIVIVAATCDKQISQHARLDNVA